MDFSSHHHLQSFAGGEKGGQWFWGLLYHHFCSHSQKEARKNKNQNLFCPPSSLSTGLSDWHWLLLHGKLWGSPQTCNKLTYLWPPPKADPSAPYLDFIASKEFHFNGLLQYSLSVHVSSCLDYLNRKNTFRRAGGGLESVLNTGLLQVHMLPTQFLASSLVSRSLHVGQFKSYWQKDTAAGSPLLFP